jgi:ferrous iron transport protein B
MGETKGKYDFTIALAGNPNTGKSTLFNALTGLHQHTGNWPGKTVSRAEGGFRYQEKNYKIVDLPGTYSLLSASPDEEVARNFILFGQPDVTLIIADATRLERNLNLVQQVLQITNRAVLVVNLMDEAAAYGLHLNLNALAENLGVPVVGCSARRGKGIEEVLRILSKVASGALHCKPAGIPIGIPELQNAVTEVEKILHASIPDLEHSTWVSLRLLQEDSYVREYIARSIEDEKTRENVWAAIDRLHWTMPDGYRDRWIEEIYSQSAQWAANCVQRDAGKDVRGPWNRRLDRILTHRWFGLPVMAALLGFVLWITITGANIPSAILADLLMGKGHPFMREVAATLHAPWWLSGLLVDGVYLTMAWIISVMLPPMAIFFPLFTILEDFGYLPRVAFNMDALFRRAGAHGKQALTLCMGFGCNAAGVIAARVIDSPRERLVAIVTNNFALCNGRWPTQIMLATVFVGALVPAAFAGVVASFTVLLIAVLGIGLTLLCS